MLEENGIIISTQLGREDHGIFTCMIHIKFDGTSQGYGGDAFDTWDESKKKRIGTAYGCEAIMEILKTLDVENWEDLKGLHVRVKKDKSYGVIKSIGHIIKDQWFSFKED